MNRISCEALHDSNVIFLIFCEFKLILRHGSLQQKNINKKARKNFVSDDSREGAVKIIDREDRQESHEEGKEKRACKTCGKKTHKTSEHKKAKKKSK